MAVAAKAAVVADSDLARELATLSPHEQQSRAETLFCLWSVS